MTLRKVLLVVSALFLFLPATALADGVDFANTGGTLTQSGFLLTGTSTLNVLTRLPDPPGPSFSGTLGTVAFTTGNLASGSFASGGTLGAGGSLTVTDTSYNTLFSGAFSGIATWTLTGNVGNSFFYTLTGPVSGTLGPGLVSLFFPGCSTCSVASGALTQLNLTSSGPFSGSAQIVSGDIGLVVPEPGTLALFGTGLVGLAGLLRRKLIS